MAVEMIGIADLVRSATVAVYSGDTFLGSGFNVAPGRVLTCAHVVLSADGPLWLWSAGSRIDVAAVVADPAQRLPDGATYPMPDTAVLTVPESGRACAPIAAEQAPNGSMVEVLGFSGRRVAVPETDRASVRLEGLVSKPDQYLLAGGQIPHGLSGAPLVGPDGVFGMVKATLNPDFPVGGYAVPIDAALAVAGEDLRAANAALFVEPLAALRAMQAGLDALPDELRDLLPAVAVATLAVAFEADGDVRPPLAADLPEWVARRLLARSLDDVLVLLETVRAGLGDRLAAVVEILACCLPARRDKPAAWVPVDAASALRREWDEAAPRVVRLGSDAEPTLRYVMRRAGVTNVPIMGGLPVSAEVGPGGAARQRVDDIDGWFCRRLGYTPEEWTAAERADALRWDYVRQYVYCLNGAVLADPGELAELRRLFAGLKFLVASRADAVPPGSEGEVLDLAPPVEQRIERLVLQIIAEFVSRPAA